MTSILARERQRRDVRQKGERQMQKRRGGSKARVVQPSLGCDRATTNQERLEQEGETR